jgi:hypothetical protein
MASSRTDSNTAQHDRSNPPVRACARTNPETPSFSGLRVWQSRQQRQVRRQHHKDHLQQTLCPAAPPAIRKSEPRSLQKTPQAPRQLVGGSRSWHGRVQQWSRQPAMLLAGLLLVIMAAVPVSSMHVAHAASMPSSRWHIGTVPGNRAQPVPHITCSTGCSVGAIASIWSSTDSTAGVACCGSASLSDVLRRIRKEPEQQPHSKSRRLLQRANAQSLQQRAAARVGLAAVSNVWAAAAAAAAAAQRAPAPSIAAYYMPQTPPTGSLASGSGSSSSSRSSSSSGSSSAQQLPSSVAALVQAAQGPPAAVVSAGAPTATAVPAAAAGVPAGSGVSVSTSTPVVVYNPINVTTPLQQTSVQTSGGGGFSDALLVGALLRPRVMVVPVLLPIG